MADMYTRPNRRKEVWIRLHPSELADAVVTMADNFTTEELDKLLSVLNIEHQSRNQPEETK